MTVEKKRAPRNRTVTLTGDDIALYAPTLRKLTGPTLASELTDTTIHQDVFEVLDLLPPSFVDLLFIDPPYNLTKSFNSTSFKHQSMNEYGSWFESWFQKLIRAVKPTGTLYVCGDWRSSSAIHRVLERHCIIRNRITWEREKGRGAKSNWKNASEDIWFCTMSEDYTFNVDAVKLKRRVIAPYRDDLGNPKDWDETQDGNHRLTHPSNLWTDLTVPFWSMPENTDHPTQKPEKLMAKIILASSKPGDVILDPFLGSGTTSVVAKKLGRRYLGVEIDQTYGCLTAKRLAGVDQDRSIQGYSDGLFWERNSRT